MFRLRHRSPTSLDTGRPTLQRIRIGRVLLLYDGSAAMAAQKAHIIYQRVFACFPEQRHCARVCTSCKDSQTAHNVGAARRCGEQARGAPHPGSLAFRQADRTVSWWMQTDEHRVLLQLNRVTHYVVAAGKIQHPVRLNRLLDRGCVVSRSVARYSSSCTFTQSFVDAARESPHASARASCSMARVVAHADGAQPSFFRNDESEIESLHSIDGALSRDFLSAFTKQCEGWHIVDHGVLKSDFSEWAFSLLMTTADPDTCSKRQSFTHN